MTTTDTTDDVTAELIADRTHDPETVPFVPSRLIGAPDAPREGLDVPTASALIRWVGECPSCGSGLDPDSAKGTVSDRDVVFEARRSDGVPRTAPLECDDCETLIEAFVEEAAEPQPWGRRDPDATRAGVHWIPAEEADHCAWIGIMPAVTLSEVSDDRAERYRADN
jgi:hypothetical protein